MTASTNVKYDFDPALPSPGEDYDKFEERLLNAGAAQTDDRGYSLGDHFLGIDEGSAGGPALPVGGAGPKALIKLRQRQKNSYGMLTKHVLDADHLTEMKNTHFQNGHTAFVYLQVSCQRAVNPLRLREMNKDFDDIDIVHQVGIETNTIKLLCKKIRTINGKRPPANRKTQSECAEKLLEVIFTTSKHFSEQATVEYNAPAASRRFQNAVTGERDFAALEAHYQELWSAAMTARLPGFHTRAAQTRSAAPTRNTLEQGLAMTELTPRELAFAGDAADTYVPRSGSPSRSLNDLACAASECETESMLAQLSLSRGTVTTTDWGMFTKDELHSLCTETDGQDGEAAYLFDSDDRGSVEVICDNCRGIGHFRRVCPSAKKFRSIDFVAAILQAKKSKLGDAPPRRPPPGGQRAPFRSMPRRFQPKTGGRGGFPNRRLGRHHSARSAEEGDDYTSADGESDVAKTASERSSSTGDSAKVLLDSGASAPKSSIRMPTSFLSDDVLYEQGHIATERETCRMAAEVPAPKWREAVLEKLSARTVLLTTAFIALASFLVACWNLLSQLVRCSIMTAMLVVCALPLVSPQLVERALPAGEWGFLTVGPEISAIVDSGCTSTALGEDLAHLVHTITEHNPKRKLYIADDSGLDILKVGISDLPVKGFNMDEPITDDLHSSRTLVVRGMKPKTILLSVRGMKRDGINTYLNDDNSTGQSDCLKLPSGTIVPFNSSKHEYAVGLESAQAGREGEDAYTSFAAPSPPNSPRTPPWRRPKPSPSPTPTPTPAPGNRTLAATENLTATFPRRARPNVSKHRALGHSGTRRINDSNIIIDGAPVVLDEHDPSSCKGCRLGNTGKGHAPIKHLRDFGRSSRGFSHFGQQIDTDICTSFASSFPHNFTCMINFCDRWGHEQFVYFLRTPSQHEVISSCDALKSAVSHRLVDGVIGRWVTDNGKMFIGAETNEMANELCHRRGFQVPNVSNTLPVAERHWGVLQRIMRSDLAHADAPACLWPWGAAQANRLIYYLSTRALDPPQSPYAFVTGNKDPVDLSWARTMYCDCTITMPERDRDGKLGNRSADACHLGYDPRRGAHFCFVPSLQRLSSFTVTEWREDAYTVCKAITADTPVEYFDPVDLPIAPVTAGMMPRRYAARALAAVASAPLTIVIAFPGRPRDGDIVSRLRALGHTVHAWDTQISSKMNLTEKTNQEYVKKQLQTADFFAASAPCTTACIHHEPPLRTWPDYPKGVPNLTATQQKQVDEANILYEFVGECAELCDLHGVHYFLESSASRRWGPTKCRWKRFANNAFFFDYPRIAALNAWYICYAQCAFSAQWQKYTGLLVSKGAKSSFQRIFDHAQCECPKHEELLCGYDKNGKAKTAIAEEFTSENCNAFASAILESCGSNQEGVSTEWLDKLNRESQQSLAELGARAYLTDEPPEPTDLQPLTHLPDSDIVPLNLRPPPLTPDHHLDTEVPMEFWMESADGAYRVSEGGIFGKVPETVQEAMDHPLWPMIQKAMEDEIKGKLANEAWKVVERPIGVHVMKSRWVFAVKYNVDGSIQVVKARFVACGYSQREGSDYDKVFAATLPGVSLRVLIACIADEDLETDHIDAVKAFTQPVIDIKNYCEMPVGFGITGFVLLLLKALEGIKQGAFLWFQHNKNAWIKLGFESWFGEPNLYFHRKLGIRVGIFADDICVGYHKAVEDDYKLIKEEYSKMINIGSTSICPIVKFVGVQVIRDRTAGTITLTQTRYIEQLADEYKGKFRIRSSPYGETKEERSAFDHLTPASPDEIPLTKTSYLSLLGKIVWPSTMTRVDCSEAVSVLCSMWPPSQRHYDLGLDVIGYLVNTKHMGITFGGRLRIPLGLKTPPPHFEQSCGLYVYHDSSFGSRPRPMGGYVILYCNGPVDWHAGFLKIVPDSTHEAESAIGSRATKAVLFLRELLKNNNRKLYGPTAALGDNEALYKTVHHEGHSARVRHYERATLLFKRAVLLLLIKPYKISDVDMVADILTKAVEKAKFAKMRDFMMNVHSSLRNNLEAGLCTAIGSSSRMMGRLLERL